MSNPMLAGECRFCRIAHGAGGGLYGAIDTPWHADSEHLALASIGALVPGWSLVIPRVHSLNLADEYKSSRFHEFVSKCVSRVEEQFGSCVIFEHGANALDSSTSCGTAHSHLHLVPVELDLVRLSRKFDENLQWQICTLEQVADLTNGGEYLLVANSYEGAQTKCAVAILLESRSQFFRRVIAESLGIAAEYNYKENPQRALSLQTAQALGGDYMPLEEVA